jgi:hypothetical protein
MNYDLIGMAAAGAGACIRHGTLDRKLLWLAGVCEICSDLLRH